MTTPEHHSSHVPPAGPSSDGSDGTWTAQRIRALGPVTDLATAARIFGLSRSVAYDLAKRGQFPVAVLRFGSRYRVPVAAILHALHLPAADEPEPATPPPDDGDLIRGGRHAWITPHRIRSTGCRTPRPKGTPDHGGRIRLQTLLLPRQRRP